MAFLNENIALTIPAPELLANDFGGILPVPAITLEARDADGYATLTVPAVTLTSTAYAGTVGTASITLPVITLDGEGLVGKVINAALTVPEITLVATGVRANSAAIEIPAPTLAATMSPVIDWDGNNLSIPAIQLDASGTTATAAIIAGTDYVVWVVNPKTGAHSNYDSFNVNAIGTFNGSTVLALPDGIYEVVNADDAGTNIDAKLSWVQSNLGTKAQKRIDSLSANLRLVDVEDIVFTLVVDEEKSRNYVKTVGNRSTGLQRYRQLIPRGLSGQEWEFGFENMNGGDFVLEEIEVISDEQRRRFQ